jgi:hypothetical protein
MAVSGEDNRVADFVLVKVIQNTRSVLAIPVPGVLVLDLMIVKNVALV